MYDPPYAVWSIWQPCGWLYRIVFILVGGLIVYSVSFAVVTVARLRSINSAKSDLQLDPAKNAVEALRRHWVGIRQATIAVFYVFGLVLFLVLQYVGVVIGDGGPGYGARQVMANFTLSCAFAANAFFGFLVLHILQWLISGRINIALRSPSVEPQPIECQLKLRSNCRHLRANTLHPACLPFASCCASCTAV
jgi:hypothetical protein